MSKLFFNEPLMSFVLMSSCIFAVAEDGLPLFSFEANAGNAKLHGNFNSFKDFSPWGGKAPSQSG
jgi:hypothetical protein